MAEFSYAATKDGRVRISWRGRVVTTPNGSAAQRFLDRAGDATPDALQLLAAKTTGNFKRGNER